MNSISDYAKQAVQYLVIHDVLVSGKVKVTKFNPINNLTHAQMAKILIRSLQLSDWYCNSGTYASARRKGISI